VPWPWGITARPERPSRLGDLRPGRCPDLDRARHRGAGQHSARGVCWRKPDQRQVLQSSYRSRPDRARARTMSGRTARPACSTMCGRRSTSPATSAGPWSWAFPMICRSCRFQAPQIMCRRPPSFPRPAAHRPIHNPSPSWPRSSRPRSSRSHRGPGRGLFRCARRHRGTGGDERRAARHHSAGARHVRSQSLCNAVAGTFESVNTNRNGWVAGGGLAYEFLQNWNVFAEYQYWSFQSMTVTFPIAQRSINSSTTANTIELGLNYKFDWGGPIGARY
jgi:hypothetical protein